MPPPAATSSARPSRRRSRATTPLGTGSLTVSNSAGSAEAKLVAGQPYARYAGVEHRVENRTEEELVWVEIELKTRKLP